MQKSFHYKSGKHIYYNATIFNDTNKPQLAIFKETRSDQIVDRGTNYKLSIIRFTIPNSAQPIFYWPTNVISTNIVVDNSKYIITLSYNGINYESNLIFEPDSLLTIDVKEAYYGIYSYQHFIKILNTAFKVAYNAMCDANLTLRDRLLTPPVMIYNREASTFDLYVSEGYINTTGDSISDSIINPLIPQIYFNTDLLNFFTNLRGFSYGELTNQSDRLLINLTGINSAIIISNNYWNVATIYKQGETVFYSGSTYISTINGNVGNIPNGAAPWLVKIINGLIVKGQWSSLSLLQSLRTIRVATQLMPIGSELISNRNSSSGTSNTSSNQNSRKLLTDFEPQLTNISSDSIRTYIQYQPAAEFRYIDIIDTRELKIIDIQLFSVDYKQTERELYILPNESCSMKLFFSEI